MTSPLGGIVPVGVGAVGAPTSIGGGIPPLQAGEGGDGFAATLAAVFDSLQTKQAATSDLAVQAATGDLRDVHDYMIASAESGLATEMVVTMKNQAVAAFNEIMRMQV
jgi:flagellar hook-basal body complex protein FliE